MKWIKQMLLSGAGAATSTGVLIGGGFILDKVIDPKAATALALLVSAVLNFALQKWTFTGSKPLSRAMLWRFIAATLFIIVLKYVAHSYLLKHRKEYVPILPPDLRTNYSTVTRTVVALVVFLLVSFPIKKFWVFH